MAGSTLPLEGPPGSRGNQSLAAMAQDTLGAEAAVSSAWDPALWACSRSLTEKQGASSRQPSLQHLCVPASRPRALRYLLLHEVISGFTSHYK